MDFEAFCSALALAMWRGEWDLVFSTLAALTAVIFTFAYVFSLMICRPLGFYHVMKFFAFGFNILGGLLKGMVDLLTFFLGGRQR